mmetsp:Transcript_22927/g.36010  ORF Transcript_22927/g.36010 Transcript_22927/m.36010 type:complete len:309 (-) Transcript_22927:1097-2023(-)
MAINHRTKSHKAGTSNGHKDGEENRRQACGRFGLGWGTTRLFFHKHTGKSEGGSLAQQVGHGHHPGQQRRPAEAPRAVRGLKGLGRNGGKAESGVLSCWVWGTADVFSALLLTQGCEVSDRIQPLLWIEDPVGDQGLTTGIILEPIVPLHHYLLPKTLPSGFGCPGGFQAGLRKEVHGLGRVAALQELKGLRFQLDLCAQERALRLRLRRLHVRGDVHVEAPHVVPDQRVHPEEGLRGEPEERALGEGPGELGHGHVERHEGGGLGVVGGQPEVRADLAGQLMPGRGDKGGGSLLLCDWAFVRPSRWC